MDNSLIDNIGEQTNDYFENPQLRKNHEMKISRSKKAINSLFEIDEKKKKNDSKSNIENQDSKESPFL